MEIDRTLYINSTLDRSSTGTLAVPRMFGKIALEEAVGSTLWDAYTTYPATNQIQGYEGVPFGDVRVPRRDGVSSTLIELGGWRRHHLPP
jgi:hypothetical protein